MTYTLYTDKDELFECEINVRNASLKDSIARLVIEAGNGMKFLLEGNINDQKCQIPIRRMHGLLKESQQGKMYLEIIVENVFFKPWSSDFIVENYTNLKIDKVKNEIVDNSKIDVSIKNKPQQKQKIKESKFKFPKLTIEEIAQTELKIICNKFGINSKTVK